MKIYKIFKFSASHRLFYPSRSDEENKALFGKCVNTHGHNYTLEVCVEGDLDMIKGYFLNLSNLSQIVQKAILEKIDHQDLNHSPFMQGDIPTVENVCQRIVHTLHPLLQHEDYHLYSCKVHETDTSSAKIYSS
jgi:6-pyruvoyltetrahydropterin/6-carboxytetrahydropterin synthase